MFKLSGGVLLFVQKKYLAPFLLTPPIYRVTL